jgi:HD-like signal output (HDOD) protein
MVGCSLKGKTPGLLLPERSLYGFTHADLSGYLLKWWNTPAEIADTAARYASALDDGAQDRELVCSIHIAQHYACRHLGVEPFCEFLPETFDVLGIDRDAFEARYQREIDIEG